MFGVDLAQALPGSADALLELCIFEQTLAISIGSESPNRRRSSVIRINVGQWIHLHRQGGHVEGTVIVAFGGFGFVHERCHFLGVEMLGVFGLRRFQRIARRAWRRERGGRARPANGSVEDCQNRGTEQVSLTGCYVATILAGYFKR